MSNINFKLILWLLDRHGLTFDQWRTLVLKLKMKPKIQNKGGEIYDKCQYQVIKR